MLALQIGIIACLLTIIYQDYKFRAVYWIVFPIFIILAALYNIKAISFQQYFTNISMNIAFVGIQIGALVLYFSLKNKRLTWIGDKHLGLGDILFFVALTFMLPPVNYILYFISSLVFVITIVGAIHVFDKNRMSLIPLAGLQALYLLIAIGLDYSLPLFSLFDDSWILTIL